MKSITTNISIALIFQCIVFTAFPQGAEKDLYLPATPSPTVASLAKYTDFPEVDQYGLAPITIPIYNVQVKDFKLPIALSYHASGIRVSQESSWVGLGFDLESLGFIARSTRDLPDDLEVNRQLNRPSPPYKYTGWLKDPDYFKDFPNLSWAQGNDEEARSAHVLSIHDGRGYTTSKIDAEPDVFYLNIGSIREKFIFDHDGHIVFLNPDSKLQITYTLYDYAKGIQEFMVVDSKGNKYYFGSADQTNTAIEETTVTSKYIGNLTSYPDWNNGGLLYYWEDGGVETRTFRTAWFIRRITVQSNQENIEFTYQSTNEEFDVPMDQYYTRQDGSSNPQNPQPILHMLWSGLKSVRHQTSTKYLNQIKTAHLTIDFDLSDRADLNGGKKLDKITVKALNTNHVVEECAFKYIVKESQGEGDTFNRTRLYLTSATLQGKPPYEFFYSSIDMPDKRSYKQDLWGLPCFKSTSLIPRIYVYPDRSNHLRYSCFPIIGDNGYTLLTGSDRTLDLTSVLAGSLQRVKYPTGGYEELVLEPNDFYDTEWGQIQGGGLRIKEIRKLNSNMELVQKKEYNYKVGGQSSGTMLNGLGFATATTYSFASNGTPIMYYQKVNDPNVWDYFTLRKSSNYFPLVNHDGALVAYTNVSVVESGNGKIEKIFYPSKNYKSNATPVKWARPHTLSLQLLDRPTDFYLNTGAITSIDLKDYQLSNENQTIWVDVYELIKGSSWTISGPVGTPKYYFLYNNGYILLTDYFRTNPVFYIQNDETQVHMAKVQKYGTNFFPFPPISDDGTANSGKISEIKYYAEGDFTHPIKQTSYTYTPVGSPVTVHGLLYTTDYVCNTLLTPMPHEQPWASLYNYNVALFIQKNLHMYAMPKSWARYKIIANQAYKVNSETTVLSGVTKTSVFDYNSNYVLKQLTENTSENTARVTKYKYANDYTYVSSNNAINKMSDRHVVDEPIEKEVSLQTGATSKILFGELKTYKVKSPNLLVLDKLASYKPNLADFNPLSSNVNTAGEFDPDDRYVDDLIFEDFSTVGNLLQYSDRSQVVTSFIWGYNNLLPVAKVINATKDEIGYASFETDDDKGYFSYNSAAPGYFSTDAKTGKRSYFLYSSGASRSLTRSLPAGEYIVSYWAKGNGSVNVQSNSIPVNNVWTFYSRNVQLTTAGTLTIAGAGTSVAIDEVQVFPADAQMNTFTHDPFIGIKTITDPNGIKASYEFDDFGRLKTVHDTDGNIVQMYDYNYKK